MIEGVSLIRPGLSEAMGLLGQWVVCRLAPFDGEDGDGMITKPAQLVGVVVPYLGGPVSAQLLMNTRPSVEILEGFEYQVFLDDVLWLRGVGFHGPQSASLVSAGPGIGAELA